MPKTQPKYHSKLYRDFKSIEVAAHHNIIRFFEKYEYAIRQLEHDEYYDLLKDYVTALYNSGSYRKHLMVVDTVIEASLQGQFSAYMERIIFREMLLQKAVSLLNNLQLNEADYILRELIRIDPYDHESITLLKQVLLRDKPRYIRTSRAISVFLFMLSAIIIAVELLFVRHFYQMYDGIVELSRNAIFALGAIFLVGGWIINRLQVEREVERFLHENRKEKN
ncbi:MAG: hypothetical protein DHS20C18_21560 [Saprospiraceae bacterium]|nr:MAG: hypothetical protein DHS20C18_21560 [Saprospiraceae bacterium]